VSKRKKPAEEKPAEEKPTLEDLGLTNGSQVKAEKISWDWPGMIVANALNLIDGHKGTGKSSVMATIAATLCAGRKLPESRAPGRKGSCLWFGSEEHFGAGIVGRWIANGCDKRTILTVRGDDSTGAGRLVLPHQEERLRQMVQVSGARTIVLDPYTALGDGMLDTRHEQSTRLYLESLARVAHEERVTVLLARHLRKGRSGSLLEHGLGSVAIPAVCRSVLRVERSPENPSICYLACVTGNHGAALGVVPYTLEERDGSVFVAKFGQRKDTELLEVLEGGEEPDERDALGDARKLLIEALKGGAVDAKTLLEEARKTGIGERTLRKVKAELRIVSKRVSAGKGVAANWRWQLPKS